MAEESGSCLTSNDDCVPPAGEAPGEEPGIDSPSDPNAISKTEAIEHDSVKTEPVASASTTGESVPEVQGSAVSESGAPEIAPETPTDGMASQFSVAQLESALRVVIRPENIATMTKRIAREGLEKHLGLECGALQSRKVDVHRLIENLVDEYVRLQAPDEADSQEASVSKVESRGESDGAEEGGRRSSSRRAATSTNSRADINASSEEEDEYDSNESSDDGKRKRKVSQKKAQPKKRLKQMQSRLMSRAAFLENSKTMQVQMGDALSFQMVPRQFSTGSMGWFYGSKVQISVGDQPLHCQLTVNCAVLGSKDWKDGKKK